MTRSVYFGCALRHRRRGHLEHAAVRRLQRACARRAGDRGTRAARAVRDGQALARQRSAAAAAVLDLRNSARRQRTSARASRSSTSASASARGLLYDAEPGARLACLGPLGRPFEPVDPPAEAWMVAGGVGLAPFVTLAEALARRGTPATLFYGARTRARSLLRRRVRAPRRAHCRLDRRRQPRRQGLHHRRRSTTRSRRCDRAASVKLYVCGPTPMMRAVATHRGFHGRPCDVSLEQVMGCGLGGCYSCVVLTRQVGAPPHFVRSCLDGPVFDAERIVWEALAH